jgi:CheY-like chemotaxis protein
MTAPDTGSCACLIMVVDDDRDVRDSIVEVLEDAEFRALPAMNGQEGLDLLRRTATKPCLILLDVMMPILDGWGFRAAQVSDPDLQSVPVVVLTAHASAAQTADQMRAAGFLRKPVALPTLLATVRQYCHSNPA